MRITKGLITAAGDRQRRVPLQTLVDVDGTTRTVLATLVNEFVGAGVAEICIVVPPGEQEEYANAVPARAGKLTFIEQQEFGGYAGAIWCARDYIAGDPFLHLVGDHIYISSHRVKEGPGSAGRLVELAASEECSVSCVQPTHESSISRFGVIGGTPIAGRHLLYEIDSVLEKPTPTLAEQRLIVPGLRAGYYLAFFGMHVLTPAFLTILQDQIQTNPSGASVSGALDTLGSRERYLGWQVSAQRYDLGPRYGLLTAQLALALAGPDRDEVLSTLVGLLSVQNAVEKSDR
ncbi:MAG: UTP--glucose-1-phosphate uridylyltransferase [Bryobacteraceae bacterium]|nr:UTP--glucose-1-phosphate uridylyltransferase [Bryobacteraceae bacterium]